MMKKRIVFGCILAVLLTAGICACGNRKSGSAAPITEVASTESSKDVTYLSIATSGNWEGILRGELMEKYIEKVKEWSDGTLILKMYYNGTLGNDLDMIEGVSKGTLSIINCVPTYQAPVVPEAALLDTPGMFNSIEEFNTFITGDYADTIQEYYHQRGLHLLSGKAFTYRIVTSRFAIKDMSDLKGLRMRTMEDSNQVMFWQSMGCTVTPMNWSSVRLAMQQGTLAAQENPLGYMFSSNLQDIQGYVTLTNHMLMVSSYLMNEEQYQALSPEHQEILQRFFDEMENELIAGEPAEEKNMRERLEQKGCVFNEPSEDIKQGIAAGREVVLTELRRKLGDAKVDEFLGALEKLRNQ